MYGHQSSSKETDKDEIKVPYLKPLEVDNKLNSNGVPDNLQNITQLNKSKVFLKDLYGWLSFVGVIFGILFGIATVVIVPLLILFAFVQTIKWMWHH
jgi:hypothetical protein